MADTMAGLFGPTPEEVRAAQIQAYQQQAQQYGRMDPFEQANAGMFTSGARIGDLIARATGGVNVAQQRAAQQQEAMQGADLQTPEGLRAVAKKMLDMGNQQSAYLLSQKAAELEKEQADINLKKAQATRALRPPSFREYESERLMSIINDPEASEEEKAMAQKRLDALNAKAMGIGNANSVQVVRVVDPTTGQVQIVRMEKGIGGKSEVLSANGQPLTPAEYSPAVKAQLAQAGAGGKAIGEGSAQAQLQLPKIEQQVTAIKSLGNQLFAHPGYQQLVGAGFPGLKALAGSNVPGAAALFGNIQGIAYLMAREELRGQGQVTEGEANMALAAFNRMNTTMNEKDFKDAYADFVQRVENVRELLKTRSKMKYESPVFNTPQVSAPSPAASMPQGAVPATPIVPMPSGDGGRADQVAIYRQEFKNAQNKFATARTPQEQAQITDYINGLRREAQRLGFSLEGENYPAGAATSAPVEKWQRVGGRLVKVK